MAMTTGGDFAATAFLWGFRVGGVLFSWSSVGISATLGAGAASGWAVEAVTTSTAPDANVPVASAREEMVQNPRVQIDSRAGQWFHGELLKDVFHPFREAASRHRHPDNVQPSSLASKSASHVDQIVAVVLR